MARKLQFADWMKRYEMPESSGHGIAHEVQIKMGGSGSASKAGARKKDRRNKKS
jgi:hypothetical protein